jgi:hypothetical protein
MTPEQQQKVLEIRQAISRLNAQDQVYYQNLLQALTNNNAALADFERLLVTVNDDLDEVRSNADYIYKSFKDSVNELSRGNTYLGLQKSSLDKLSSIARQALDIRRGDVVYEEKKFKSLVDQARLNLENLELVKTQGGLTGDAADALEDQIAAAREFQQTLEKINETEKEINKELGFIPKITAGIDSAFSKLGLPQLGFQNALEKTKQLGQEAKGLNQPFSAMATFTKQVGNNLSEQLTSANLIQLAIVESVDALMKADKSSGELAKGFNMSYNDATKLRGELNQIANLSGDVNVNTKGLQESMMAVGKTLGSNAILNEKDLVTFTKLREQSGLANEELASMQRFTLATGGNLEDNTSEFLAQAQITAQNNGVVLNTKQLLQETANVSDAIKLSVGGTAGGFAKAAATVKALGMNLEKVDDIASSLLDFESSISAELEAELITGKDLNLEKARSAALNGDLATVAEEIAKQTGSAAEFSKMNRIQQEAIAKSVGMSRDDLAKSLVEREALANLSGEEAEAGKETFDNLVKQYGIEKAQKMIKEEGFNTLMKQQDVQERFNKGIDKLKDALMGLVEPILSFISPLMDLVNKILPLINLALSPIIYSFQKIGDVIGFMVDNINKFVGFLEKSKDIAGVFLGIAGSIYAYQNRTFLLKVKEQAIDKISAGWAATKAAFQKEGVIYETLIAAKKQISTAFENKSLIKGLASLAINAAKAVAGIPFVGPLLAAAAAAGAYALGKSYIKGDDTISPGYGKRAILSPEGTIALNDNDTVVAGTDLGGKNKSRNNKSGKNDTTGPQNSPSIDLTPLVNQMNAMNNTLQQILKKEGSVYIDGTKAGRAFTVGTYNLQ